MLSNIINILDEIILLHLGNKINMLEEINYL